MGLFILIFRSLSRDLRVGGRRGALATLRYLFLSFSLSISLSLATSFSVRLFDSRLLLFLGFRIELVGSPVAQGGSGSSSTSLRDLAVTVLTRPCVRFFRFQSTPLDFDASTCGPCSILAPFFSSFCDILRCFSHGSKSSTIKRYPPSLPSAPARRFRGTKNRIAFELEKISGSFFTKKLDFELTSSRRKKAGSSSLFNLATATDFRLSKLFSFSLRYV